LSSAPGFGSINTVRPLNIVTKSEVIQWKAACWIVVGGFSLLSAAFIVIMGRLLYIQHRPELWSPDSFGGPLWCGNSVTDPLELMLGFGAPVSLAGVAGLAVLAYRGQANRSLVASAAGLALACIVGLLVFGFKYFRHDLGGAHLSEIVWWLRPFGI
jgi:hypothetical protein